MLKISKENFGIQQLSISIFTSSLSFQWLYFAKISVLRMYNGKKVVVVLPAYNAALTMEKTIAEIPMDVVDDLVLVDDNSTDNSIEVAQKIGF